MKIRCLVVLLALASCTVERAEPPSDGTSPAGTQAADGDTATAAVQGRGGGSPSDTSYQVDSGVGPESRPPSSADVPPDTARLLPFDEADSDAELLAFRRRLIEAVGSRDTTVLFESMTEDIRISFGTRNGRAGFREMWNPSHPDSEVWKLLGRVLGGGGRYETGPTMLPDGSSAGDRFRAPYYFAAFPGERYEVFQHGVLLDADVVLRADPSPDADAVDTLSFAIVRVPSFEPYEEASGDWIRVQLASARFGYVPVDRIASPVGYRALFNKIDGSWKMTAFVAGD